MFLGHLLSTEALEADVIAEGEFGTDVAAATALRRAGEERLAAFQGGGGALMNRTGITGLGRAT